MAAQEDGFTELKFFPALQAGGLVKPPAKSSASQRQSTASKSADAKAEVKAKVATPVKKKAAKT